MSRTYGYTGGQRGFVNHEGVEQGFQIGTSRDYDEWMSDDNATGSFDEHMYGNHFDRNVDQAYEKAEEEYERRLAIHNRITANEDSIAMLKNAADNLNQNVAPEALPPEKPLSNRAQMAMNMPDSPGSDYSFMGGSPMDQTGFADSHIFKDSDEATAGAGRLDLKALQPINSLNDPVSNLNPVALDFATTQKNKVKEEMRRQGVPTRGPETYNQSLSHSYN